MVAADERGQAEHQGKVRRHKSHARTDGVHQIAGNGSHSCLHRFPALLRIFPGFLNPNKAPPTSSDLLLLPGAWATAYHNHITEKVKRIPPPLNTRDILCEQHGRLLFNPVPFDFRPTEPLPEPYHVRGSKEGEIAVCERKFLDSIIRDGKYVENDTDAQYIELVIKEKGEHTCPTRAARDSHTDNADAPHSIANFTYARVCVPACVSR